jgi:hypothetical protein
MDRLGDLAGAIRALERAVQLLRDPGLREDAMARLKDMARNEPMRLLGTDPMLRAGARGY